ncbi:MAG: septal ring lytic transglycosylase RlpA family protein [Dysgonamonadaceae bacterium]|nr:septal ring lytic transglycosylase RlpA family protein [Dysgonamonadaceae bacterium]MEA5080075.1 septal ring lytic transglycosylase RlpA family protein [Dysgonamonadaceae bacterium]
MKRFIIWTIIMVLGGLISITWGQESGKASFYSHKLHGRNTSSGIPYHKDSLTCAHRTLPFGTFIQVKNLNNNKTVVVKVTDRGPFSKSRIIDLSYAAAKEIGIVQQGIGNVEIKKWQFYPYLPIELLNFNNKLFLEVKNKINPEDLNIDKEKALLLIR